MSRPTAARPLGRLAALLGLLAVAIMLVACTPGGSTPPPDASPEVVATPTPTPTPRFDPEPPEDWAGETVSMLELPPEAIDTLLLITQGGPYPYEQDGGLFGNREGLLPDRPPGTYREYTVETPDSPDRGPRRLVIGNGRAVYYTEDHYESFRYVVP